MTVSYNFDVSSTTWLSSARILFRWRGSMWKAVSSEAITWIFLYALINIIIRYQLNETQVSRIPLVFLLGFFVSVVFNRWVAIFNHIGFIDNLALVVAALIRGSDAETKLLRRNIIRYSVLSQALVFRDISIQVRKRFPDIESIMHSGLLMEKEFEIFQRKEMQDNKYWIPIQWAISLAIKARDDGKIPSDVLLWNIIERIRQFRTDLQYLCCYDWVPVPMSYPQIAFLAVRIYFATLLIARQCLPIDDFDIYVPIMTLLELILLVGWVKVAEAILNPFGEDDDDFECNYVIDRNLSTGFEIVELYEQPPCDEYDSFWTMSIPKPRDTWEAAKSTQLPKKKTQPYHGSVADLSFESKPAHSTAHNPTGAHDLISTIGRSIRRRQSRKIVPLQPVPENDSKDIGRSIPLFSGSEAVINSYSPSASHERIPKMTFFNAVRKYQMKIQQFLAPVTDKQMYGFIPWIAFLKPTELRSELESFKAEHSPEETVDSELHIEDFPLAQKTNSAWLDTTDNK
ncbi:bestrophin, RFP-TM, chloride channel domain-containing protein [Ditylenchus destructor]|uniref:Bestrophin homolog n=1 Tax=Ditylenchus destructor TaxID=166010 RepID=A0AAD4NDD5_9BILA|nr:bestrophin, RFP-TM, chloride channel domain-containing protein [Ditylenchus destructor]